VVEAREEERRRIRRDLHDGLGPVLTGVGYTADAALNVLRAHPERSARLRSQLRSDTSDAISEVRRIVEGLRPPALDEVGLAAALRQRAVRYSGRLNVDVRCSVPAAEGPDLLPAAVEVVAYRVASEAMTNAARHAVPRAGSTCLRVTVNLSAEFAAGSEHLVVTVEDDGAPANQWTTGTGLASMAARCDEVGGTVRSGAYDGGWRVQARLPLPS
jgi:signal transduction histidine kinase